MEIEKLYKAAELEAQFNLGIAYAIGHGTAKDETRALEWFHKAAEKGHAGAQFNLGLAYAIGHGTAKDETQALEWFHKAAEKGHAEAQFNLGMMYANGKGVTVDKIQGVAWYRKAAEQGFADAQLSLGLMYAHGEGVTKDNVQAVVWYRKAAEQGLAQAQYDLGFALEEGLGIPQDATQAVVWYRKAAEQGFAKAQHNLGVMYAGGIGIARDKTLATEWLRKAAEQGDRMAQYNLEVMKIGVTEKDIAILVLVCNGETWADKENFHSGNLPTLLNGSPLPEDEFIVSSEGRHVRRIDFSLSTKGVEQAYAAQKAINNLRETYGLSVLLASPEERSLETASAATRHGEDFKEKWVLEGLMDRGQGQNVGLSKKLRNGLLDPFPNPITDKTGFENLSTFADRVRKSLNQSITPLLINKKFPVIFTHRYVIAAVLNSYDPRVDIHEVGERIPNCKPIILMIQIEKSANGDPSEKLLDAFYYEPAQ